MLRPSAPPSPLAFSATLQKAGPLEVQTLITELEYFSKLQGIAPGDKRKEESAEQAGEGRRASLPSAAEAGLSAGRRRPPTSGKSPHLHPPRKARRPLQAALRSRESASSAQGRAEGVSVAAGRAARRDAGLDFSTPSKKVSTTQPLTFLPEALKGKFLLMVMLINTIFNVWERDIKSFPLYVTRRTDDAEDSLAGSWKDWWQSKLTFKKC